jgi:hypothetical protein
MRRWGCCRENNPGAGCMSRLDLPPSRAHRLDPRGVRIGELRVRSEMKHKRSRERKATAWRCTARVTSSQTTRAPLFAVLHSSSHDARHLRLVPIGERVCGLVDTLGPCITAAASERRVTRSRCRRGGHHRCAGVSRPQRVQNLPRVGTI